jgi:catechol 2,3-dioxygenase-like lactoylglutathione lyase family enzyme
MEDNLDGAQAMLVVSDLARSLGFYAATLGFAIASREGHIALLARGGLQLYLATEGPPTPDKFTAGYITPLPRYALSREKHSA